MRTFLLFSLLVWCGIGFAQNITTVTVEIYQDGSIVDTQVFNGFTPAMSISEDLTVNTSALNPGLHTFIVTVTDADGVSSILETGAFFHETQVTANAQITAIEYFFNTDPGSGTATSIVASPASEVIATETLNTSSLATGFHTLHLRAKDQNNNWGPYATSTIYVASGVGFNDVVQIEALEYFIDTDPGAGNGTSITVSTSNDLNLTESINVSGEAPGFHTVFLRGKLENGTWGPYTTQTIFVESSTGFADAVNIEALEYFIDTDPGAGNGTDITVSTSNNLSLTETINVSGEAPGFHTVYLRGKLENGTWGPYTTQTIFVESSAGFADAVNIEALEYFVDTDPGAGNGTSISVSTANNLSLTETIDLSGEEPGFHTIYLRGKLENGPWGVYTSQTILVESSVGQGDVVVVESLEYFINTDPGQGLGTPISVAPSSLQQLNETIDISSLSTGFHTLYLRGKLENGTWGSYQSATILVEAGATGNQITAIEYFINTDPGVGAATSASGTFPVSNFAETVNLATASLVPGNHLISVRAQDDQGRWGNYLTQAIEILSPELNQSVADGNWNNPATWSRNAIPAENDSVVVAHAVSLDLASPSVFALTLTTGGNLDLTTNEVHVKGRFKKETNGILTPSTGKLVLDGGTQTYQHEGDITFFQLAFGGTGTKVLDFASGDELIINDSLGIASGLLIDIQQDNEVRLIGNAEFVNNGSLSSSEKWSLIAAGNSHTITGGDFKNLTMEATVTLALINDFQYSGTFTSPGTGVTLNLNESTMNIGTSWAFSAADNLTFGTNGTLAASMATSFSNGVALPHLIINTTTETFTASSALTFGPSKMLTINSGTAVTEALTFSGSGGISLTGGTLSLTDQVITFGNGGSLINNGGQVNISGNSSALQRATVSDQFTITQNSGNFNWSDVTLSGTGGNGLSLLGGSATLTNLTFENGSDASYLTFGAGYDGQTFSGFNFTNGPTHNVTINDGIASTITFDEYQGEFGGSDHDNPGTSGTINWTNEIVPDVTPPVITVTALSTLDQSPPLGGTIDDNEATITVTINSVQYTDVQVATGTWSIADDVIGPLDVGTYEVTASATDASGNEGTDTSNDELTILPATTTANEASEVGTDQFTANWSSASGGVNQYLLDVSSDSEFSSFVDGFQNAMISGISSAITGLTDNTTYYYRVRVQYNSGDISDYSDAIQVTTLEEDTTPPVITVTSISTTDLSPAISGTIDDNEATVSVTINDVEYTDIIIGDGTWSIAENVVGPLDVGTYEVSVTATDTNGNEGTDTSTDELTILPSPTDAIAATDIGTEGFTANWSAVEGGVSNYLLDVSTQTDFSSFIIGYESAPVTSTSQEITDLSSNTTYFYRVRAVFGSGNTSDYSDTIQVTTTGEPPVITITSLSTFDLSPALSGTVDSDVETIVLTINDVNYTDVVILEGNWTIDADVIGQLDVGTYDISITVTDLDGNTGTDDSADELVILPSPTVAQAATGVSSNAFTANWSSVEGGVSHYLLDVSTEEDFSTFLSGLENAQQENTSQEITDLNSSSSYYYRVRAAFNSGDISDYSDTIAVTTQQVTFSENDSLALVQIYTELDGTNWTQNDHWLSGNLDSWFGVKVEGTRVSDLNLTDNNLSGTLSAIESGLELLDTLDLSQNSLMSIGSISGIANTTFINVSNNQLQFGSLETLVNLSDEVVYTNQALVLDQETISEEIGNDLVIDRTISGENNIYRWFKNGESISNEGPTLTLENLSLADEGAYSVEVTNALVIDLTLTSNPVNLSIRTLDKDRVALLALFEALDGINWTNNADWPNQDQNDLESWEGIDLIDGRVGIIRLADANLTGEVPVAITELTGATEINLSENNISGLPDMSTMTNLTLLNISGNLLDFADLEPNANINGIDYSDQQPFGDPDQTINVPKGNDYQISFSLAGTANQYQWQAAGPVINGVIPNANGSSYLIEQIDYENMGIYTLSATNEQVPGLTLTSHPVVVNATAELSLNPTYFDIDDEETLLDEGSIQLLQVTAPQTPFDSVQQLNIEEDGYLFDQVILGDYLISVRTDTLFLRNKGGRTDSVRLLPTYFESAFLWEEADLLQIRENNTQDIRMQAQPPELTAADGDGRIELTVESDFANDPEKEGTERIEARRKVKRAGCSLRRRRRAGGGRGLNDEYELIVYKETDDDGRVSFDFLPEGTYRLNIEYPGIPMDPTSFVEFTIGEGGIEDNSLTLEATVSEDGIVVELVQELGFYRQYFKDLELYPNPADQELNIRYKKLNSGEVHVQLINLQGKVLMERQVPRGFNQLLQLDISDQDPGVYLLRFLDPTATSPTLITYRVLISR